MKHSSSSPQHHHCIAHHHPFFFFFFFFLSSTFIINYWFVCTTHGATTKLTILRQFTTCGLSEKYFSRNASLAGIHLALLYIESTGLPPANGNAWTTEEYIEHLPRLANYGAKINNNKNYKVIAIKHGSGGGRRTPRHVEDSAGSNPDSPTTAYKPIQTTLPSAIH